MKTILITIAICVSGVLGNAQAVAPTLTQAQQDQFTIAALAQSNAEKALRLASIDYQQAKEAFEKVVQSLQVPGYNLQQNAQTGKLEYVKSPDKKEK